jgi:hypothetical protein
MINQNVFAHFIFKPEHNSAIQILSCTAAVATIIAVDLFEIDQCSVLNVFLHIPLQVLDGDGSGSLSSHEFCEAIKKLVLKPYSFTSQFFLLTPNHLHHSLHSFTLRTPDHFDHSRAVY